MTDVSKEFGKGHDVRSQLPNFKHPGLKEGALGVLCDAGVLGMIYFGLWRGMFCGVGVVMCRYCIVLCFHRKSLKVFFFSPFYV